MGNNDYKRYKGQLINWPIVADMDTEDYELKPLNQQQVAILLGALTQYKWRTRWVDLELSKDELESLIGDIEYRLMLNEEGFSMTPEELSEAICNGLVCAAPKIGLMLASGASSGNSFDEDGNVVTPDTGEDDAGLPEDDPETPLIDETLAAKAGGVIAINVGITEIWASMFAWYGADATPDMTSSEMVNRLGNLYIWESEDDLTAFVGFYYLARGVPQTVPVTWASTVQSRLFCKGRTKQVMNEWIYDTLTGSVQEQSLNLVTALSLQQLEVWYEYGIQAQSTDYIGYSCTKIAPESGTHNSALSNTPQFTTVGIWKAGHRFLIKMSGTFTDSDNANIVFDGMYEHNTITGVKTWKPTQFLSNAGVPTPSQANVPFAPDHIYEFTVDKSPTVANGTCVIQGDNGSAGLPNTTGIVTFTVEDLGEFSL